MASAAEQVNANPTLLPQELQTAEGPIASPASSTASEGRYAPNMPPCIPIRAQICTDLLNWSKLEVLLVNAMISLTALALSLVHQLLSPATRCTHAVAALTANV